MGFEKSLNYESGMSTWKGKWLSIKGIIERKTELLEKLASEKNVSVSLLKRAIPKKFIGLNEILGLTINDNCIFLEKDSGIIEGYPVFLRKNSYSIRKAETKYEITDVSGNVLFFYNSYQSKYNSEDDFNMYIYAVKDKSDKIISYISLTDKDCKTENTDGTSIHAFISANEEGLSDSCNICTFVQCDGSEDIVFKELFKA